MSLPIAQQPTGAGRRADQAAGVRRLTDSLLGTLGELYDIVIKCSGPWRASVGLLSGPGPRALVSWMTWMAILAAWPLIGLGVAYPVGCFIRGAEALDSANDLTPPFGSPE